MLYSSLDDSTVQYSKYNTVQFGTAQYCKMWPSKSGTLCAPSTSGELAPAPYCTVLYATVQHSSIRGSGSGIACLV